MENLNTPNEKPAERQGDSGCPAPGPGKRYGVRISAEGEDENAAVTELIQLVEADLASKRKEEDIYCVYCRTDE